MNIFKTFLYSFLNLCLLPILVINIMGVLSTLGVDWSTIFIGMSIPTVNPDSYFGFSSFLVAIKNFPAVNTFYDGVRTLNGTFIRFIEKFVDFGTNGVDIFQILEIILEVLVSPILLLCDIISFVLLILGDIISIFTWFIKLLSGFYNLPLITA